MWEISGRTEWERGTVPSMLGAARGGWVRMSGFAVARERYDRQAVRRVSGWARDYLRRAALADFGCAILGVFVAAQLRFGNDVTGTYVALSLALAGALASALSGWPAGMTSASSGPVRTSSARC